jgi:hypothetical protein
MILTNRNSGFNYIWIPILLIMSVGCEKVFDEADDFTITTELIEYSRGQSVKITILNNSSSAIYYRRCGANNFRHRLIKLIDNEEVVIAPDACNSFNQTIFEVRDGQTSELTIPLNFSVPTGMSVVGNYQFEITMTDALNQMILPPKNKSNIFGVNN